MSKNFPIPKFNHRRSVSTEYQMGCFPNFPEASNLSEFSNI
ncbi:hypothetical protein T09_9501 [Trichinella sp. T9]|nr:hypothetical protein T09_9501 [Trichinella sp. T9]